MYRLLAVALLGVPGVAGAQSLAGTWVYQSEAGAVRLTLQEQGAAVSGSMIGADGNTFTLQGTVDGGRATGTISVAGGSGFFAAGMVGQQLKLVVAEVDPSTGQPDLSNGWELDFNRADGAPVGQAPGVPQPGGMPGGAGAGAPGMGGAPGAGPEGVPPQAENTPLLREWLGHLRGRKLSFRETYNGGLGGGFSNQWDAWLCSDGTFLFRQASQAHIDAGGAWGNARDGGAARGIWRIVENNGQIVLQYKMENEEPQWALLTYQNGATYLDRSRIYVTDDNPHCR